MEITWKAFFAMWAVTIVSAFLWDGRAGGGMIAFAVAAIVMRVIGYEQGWRRFTVMLFIGAIFMLLGRLASF